MCMLCTRQSLSRVFVYSFAILRRPFGSPRLVRRHGRAARVFVCVNKCVPVSYARTHRREVSESYAYVVVGALLYPLVFSYARTE